MYTKPYRKPTNCVSAPDQMSLLHAVGLGLDYLSCHLVVQSDNAHGPRTGCLCFDGGGAIVISLNLTTRPDTQPHLDRIKKCGTTCKARHTPCNFRWPDDRRLWRRRRRLLNDPHTPCDDCRMTAHTTRRQLAAHTTADNS